MKPGERITAKVSNKLYGEALPERVTLEVYEG